MIAVNFTNNLMSIQSELFNFAYKLTSDREDANDLLQDTSLKALTFKDNFLDETNFKSWIYTIMRNIFINKYKKEARNKTYIDQTDNSFFINSGISLEGNSTESDYDVKEIHHIVNSLPEENRNLFIMHVSGFKYREIAKRKNLPLGTVKSRLFFIRQQLQEELQDFR